MFGCIVSYIKCSAALPRVSDISHTVSNVSAALPHVLNVQPYCLMYQILPTLSHVSNVSSTASCIKCSAALPHVSNVRLHCFICQIFSSIVSCIRYYLHCLEIFGRIASCIKCSAAFPYVSIISHIASCVKC